MDAWTVVTIGFVALVWSLPVLAHVVPTRPSRWVRGALEEIGELLEQIQRGDDPKRPSLRGLRQGRPLELQWVERDLVRFSTPCANPAVEFELHPSTYGELREALDALAGLSQGDEVSQAVGALLRVPFKASRVRLGEGRLEVDLFLSHVSRGGDLDLERVTRVLDHVVRIGGLCQRIELDLEERGLAFALSLAGTGAVCPYCRDALAPEQEELWSCPSCQTLHHAECEREAGDCTVFACQGRVGARERV